MLWAAATGLPRLGFRPCSTTSEGGFMATTTERNPISEAAEEELLASLIGRGEEDDGSMMDNPLLLAALMRRPKDRGERLMGNPLLLPPPPRRSAELTDVRGGLPTERRCPGEPGTYITASPALPVFRQRMTGGRVAQWRQQQTREPTWLSRSRRQAGTRQSR